MSEQPSQSSSFVPSQGDPLADDPELRLELAHLFLEDCPRLMAEIQGAISRQDSTQLRQAAHTLKGSAGVFRDEAAYGAALQMEHVGRDADWSQSEAVWQVLNREMVRLMGVLTQLVTTAH